MVKTVEIIEHGSAAASGEAGNTDLLHASATY
jgi:hypothetical protein